MFHVKHIRYKCYIETWFNIYNYCTIFHAVKYLSHNVDIFYSIKSKYFIKIVLDYSGLQDFINFAAFLALMVSKLHIILSYSIIMGENYGNYWQILIFNTFF